MRRQHPVASSVPLHRPATILDGRKARPSSASCRSPFPAPAAEGDRRAKTRDALTKEEKKRNQEIASQRVANENVIGMLKRIKIIADRYRNRRKRFGLRFNLIAGIYNLELL
jgi:hypothetical protein